MIFSNRPFGLETECYAPQALVQSEGDGTLKAVGNWLPASYAEQNGDRLQLQVKGRTDFDPTAGLTGRVWSLEPDASLSLARGGVELISPKLSGVGDRDHVFSVISLLQQGGFHVTQSAGLHATHDASDFDLDAFKRLAANFYVQEPSFDRLMHSSRNYQMGVGPASSVRSVMKDGHREVMRRIAKAQTVNEVIHHAYDDLYLEAHFKLAMDKFAEKGAVEWRHHHATVDPHASTAWISLSQMVMDHSANSPDLLVPGMQGSDFEGAAEYVERAGYKKDDALLDRLLMIGRGPDNQPTDVETYYRGVVAHREEGKPMPSQFGPYASHSRKTSHVTRNMTSRPVLG